MTADGIDNTLATLAERAGVSIDWVDAWGRPQSVEREQLLAVLRALTGRSLGDEREVAEAAESIVADRPEIEPVLVAWGGSLPSTPVPPSTTEAAIHCEDGEIVPCRLMGGSVTSDVPLPMGYHTLVIDGGRHASHVFSAPMVAAAYPRGLLGLIAPTYSLWSDEHDTGVGTLAEFDVMAGLCARSSVDLVGTLPLLATFPDEPSPYSPASRRAWNETLADLTRLEGWDRPPPRIGHGSSTGYVDYDAAGALIAGHLAAYARHVERSPGLLERVRRFIGESPEMARYARFRATADVHGRDWRRWDSSASPAPDRLLYHEVAQWVMHDQLAHLSDRLDRRGQYLYVDLPIGCNPDGYDIWDTPDLYAAASLGAPPDTLFVGGQDWGLPATIPARARADGHLGFRKAIRHQLSIAGVLRIDHVMGLLRTWWVPHGAGAADGAFVRQPVEELFAIVCLESSRVGVGIVGENLGTVPQEIRDAMELHGLAGMSMASSSLTPPSATDLVALSSHDTPTFHGWWDGDDIDDLVDLGVFDDDRASAEREGRHHAIHDLRTAFSTGSRTDTMWAMFRWMAASDAAIALLTLDDLIGERRRQNVPGTYHERPNWRLRYERSIEDLAQDDDLREGLSALARLRPG